MIRYGFTTEEVMVCLIINGDRLPEKETLIERLSVLPGMTSISYNVNTERTNVILGKHTECIWGMPYITDYIHLRNTGDFSVEDTAIAIIFLRSRFIRSIRHRWKSFTIPCWNLRI